VKTVPNRLRELLYSNYSNTAAIRPAGFLSASFLWLLLLSGCDQGLAPTSEVDPEGNLIVNITYEGEWPPEEEIFEFRFIAFDFFPETVADIFFNLENLIISVEKLLYGVESETLVFEQVENRTIIYSAVAWQFGPDVFDNWRAAGETQQQYTIEGNTVEMNLVVDFDNLPPFPPVPAGNTP
jgi:hypothetical protein